MPWSLAQVFTREFLKWVPLSDSIISGVPCRQDQYGVSGGSMGYCICFKPPSGCLHHGEHITLTIANQPCHSSPYLYFCHCSSSQRVFILLACLIVAHVSQSWITCAIASIVKSTPRTPALSYVVSLPWWPEVSRAFRARNNSPLFSANPGLFEPSQFWQLDLPDGFFVVLQVAQLLGTWASTWCTFTTTSFIWAICLCPSNVFAHFSSPSRFSPLSPVT